MPKSINISLTTDTKAFERDPHELWYVLEDVAGSINCGIVSGTIRDALDNEIGHFTVENIECDSSK